MLLEQRPTEYGIDRYIWTGKVIADVIKTRWNIELKDSQIYQILDELDLFRQKAHRDYENADPEAQRQFVAIVIKIEELKPLTKLIFYDEFAVYDRPRGSAKKERIEENNWHSS